jgi:hypothetical protein
MFEDVFLASRQCVWLENHICVVSFLRAVCQVTRNKKQVLKKVSLPTSVTPHQSPPSHTSRWHVFCLCGLTQFRFESSSKKKKKKPKSRKGLSKFRVYTVPCVLNTPASEPINLNLNFTRLPINFSEDATNFKVKMEKILNKDVFPRKKKRFTWDNKQSVSITSVKPRTGCLGDDTWLRLT